jgi:hypothetical protein
MSPDCQAEKGFSWTEADNFAHCSAREIRREELKRLCQRVECETLVQPHNSIHIATSSPSNLVMVSPSAVRQTMSHDHKFRRSPY